MYPRERTKIEAGQIFDEEMRSVTNDLIIHLTEAKDRDGVIQERSVEIFCLTMWISMTYMGSSQGF